MRSQARAARSSAGTLGACLLAVTALGAQVSPSAAPSLADQTSLAGRIDALASNFVQAQAAERGNLCFSPLVMAATLLSLEPGMKASVREAIDAKLLPQGQDLAHAVATLRALSAGIGARTSIEWRRRQLAWFDREVEFDAQWLAALRRFEVPLEPFAHGDGLEALRQRIRTGIRDAVDATAATALQLQGIAASTRLVLVEALHLRAAWRHEFDAKESGVGLFTIRPGHEISVSYLKQHRTLSYAATDHDEVVRLELAAAGLVVDFALPKEGAGAAALPTSLQNLLEGDWGNRTPRLRPRSVELAVPSFEIGASLTLDEVSRGCGCGAPELRVATAEDPGRFGVCGDQTTMFAIDEHGIGATSVSSVSAWGPGTAEQRIVHLTLCRPFAFAVRDTSTGLVLLCGIVREPPALPREAQGERDGGRDR